MINSVYKPINVKDFQADCLNFNGQAISGSVAASGVSNFDLTLTDDHLLTGGTLLVSGGIFGDKITLQVVDTGGIIPVPYRAAYPNYPILNQFVTNYGIVSDSQRQFSLDINYPAKIFAGLTLRYVYTATATVSTRLICLNYSLHKTLI